MHNKTGSPQRLQAAERRRDRGENHFAANSANAANINPSEGAKRDRLFFSRFENKSETNRIFNLYRLPTYNERKVGMTGTRGLITLLCMHGTMSGEKMDRPIILRKGYVLYAY